MNDDEHKSLYGELSDEAFEKIKGALEDNRKRKARQAQSGDDDTKSGPVAEANDAASKEAKHLKTDQGRQISADNTRGHLEQRRKAEIDRLKTDNKQRKSFFRFMLLVGLIPVLVASFVMLRLAWDGDVGDSVVVAFFVSVVVEVLGLAVIVANYLFPKRGSLPDDKEIWNELED